MDIEDVHLGTAAQLLVEQGKQEAAALLLDVQSIEYVNMDLLFPLGGGEGRLSRPRPSSSSSRRCCPALPMRSSRKSMKHSTKLLRAMNTTWTMCLSSPLRLPGTGASH